jgi:glycosyltransferase involved in cell wall biosynthesis
MKVLIALTSQSAHISGVQRHGINLACCLLTRQEVTAVYLIAAPWQRQLLEESAPADPRLHLQFPHVGRGSVSRNWWFYHHLPALAAHLSVDLVHLAYPMPVNRRAFHCPLVVTLHDLYPYDIPDNFGFPKVLFHRAVLHHCLSDIDAIASVSESTHARLAAIAPSTVDKSLVICNSVAFLDQQKNFEPVQSDEPFLLCVAQHRRNKNVLFALRIFHRLLTNGSLPASSQMVIVGIAGPETSAIQRFVATCGLARHVLLVDGISDQHLHSFYRNCRLLLAPSTVEGFGLPVAEALMFGCRVLCSDIPAFREVGAGHCRFLPVGEDQLEVWTSAALEEMQLPKPSPALMPKFGRAVLGEQYLRLYQTLIETLSPLKAFNTVDILSAAERHPLI